MEKKMTKRDYFNALKGIEEVKANADLMGFIDHEIELLDKKNSKEKKPTATQTANVGIKAGVADVMEPNKLYTVTELVKVYGGEITNQKMSALLRQMIAEGTVERVEEKRKAYFRLVPTATAED